MFQLVEKKWWTLVVMVLATGAGAGPHCEQLAEMSRGGVSVRGEACDVVLQWRGEAARAAAALLAAVLRHAVGLARVHLAAGPADACRFTGRHQPCRLAVLVAARWGACELPGEWRVLGAGAAPASPRLHARLAPAAASRADCARASAADFYADAARPRDCGFRMREPSGAATVYVPRGTLRNATATDIAELVEDAAAASMRLRLVPCDRRELVEMLRNDTHSFLFLDFEMYADVPHTMPVAGPRCACACRRDSEVRRLVDSRLVAYAPRVVDAVRRLAPSPRELRAVLDLAARNGDDTLEESACEWAKEHDLTFRSWNSTYRYDYWAAVMRCQNDPDGPEHRDILEIVNDELWNFTRPNYWIELKFFDINCTVPEVYLYELTHTADWYRCIGVVAGAAGALVADDAALAGLPLVLYEPPAGRPAPGARLAAGAVPDLARELRRFLGSQGWRRVAVLSEPTALAAALEAALRDGGELVLHAEPLPSQVTRAAAERALLKLRAYDARVFLVNAGAEAAGALAAAAEGLGMAGEEYAWVAREWPDDGNSSLRVFTVSFRCRAAAKGGGRAGLRGRLAARLGDGPRLWAARPSALVDAVLTLAHGFEALVRLHPETRDDPHGAGTVRTLWESFDKSNVTGLCQELRYSGERRAGLLAVVDEWRGGRRRALAHWRAGGAARWLAAPFAPGAAPTDGAGRCLLPAGDPFAPACRDVQWGGLALLLALALVAACVLAAWARRAVARRLAGYRIRVAAQVMARRQAATQAIVGHLVERSAVEMRRELGAGRFGHVWLAVLRAAGRAPRAVAAKALREGAAPSEESEFLREACTLAALDHEHVVRLVGVSVTDGPPLVLMEFAFFGDLLRYLRARRHLAEGAEEGGGEGGAVGAEEQAHVSAEALTRFVREAASALGYLAYRGVVHRDVRAANCLVDARRRLKLGDFGMARETCGGGADGEAEYACRRRGLFPVLWMAPESLERGAFSAASDVWALGVLALEVVTLGARPYGARSPLRVLQYVAGGGRPPLPLDATAQTRGVALACWRRAPRERPSAAAVVEYLAARPAALRPALAADCDGTDADSGFGEPDAPAPPSPPDSPHSPHLPYSLTSPTPRILAARKDYT